MYDGAEYTVLVRPDDSARRWVLHVGPTLTVPPGDLDEKGGAVTLTGSAAAIYLGLWNRGDELTCLGDPEFLARWRAVQQVFWVD